MTVAFIIGMKGQADQPVLVLETVVHLAADVEERHRFDAAVGVAYFNKTIFLENKQALVVGCMGDAYEPVVAGGKFLEGDGLRIDDVCE